METNLDKLNTIERVSTPDHLYDAVLNRIDEQKSNEVNSSWILRIAAGLMLLIGVNGYVAMSSNASSSDDVSSIVPVKSNMLYNE